MSDINRRNYYFNLSVEQNLSVRQLKYKTKSNSYERLLNKPKNIELIVPKNEYTILEDMKNPIIIKVDKNKEIKNEKDLELTILSEIKFVLTQFGKGFTFVGSQYKINNYYLYNVNVHII